jgi:hypothetical protein
VYYDTLVMLGMGDSPDRRPLQSAISFQPVIDMPAGFGQPAVGALVTFSQSWYAKGITLGHMLHSLALAPGEATRIAVIDWSRRTRAAVSETIDEAERLDTATEHSRAISEVQNAVADEMQTGGSMSSGWAKSTSKGKSGGLSVGGGIAGAYQGVTGVLGFGGGTASSSQEAETTTEASSSSWSVGSRSVMAEMAQHVNDRTEQHSTSVRNRRASAVREVAQSEHEEVSTRIVANYNHMHALTVQYYEVVQIYRVVAQIHGVHRVLFLPFELLDFSRERAEDIVARFRAQLVAAALTRRVQILLLDDRGSIEVRSAVRVLLPIFAGEIGVGVGTIAVALMRPGTAGPAPSGGDTAEPVPPTGGSGGSTTSPPPPGRRVVRPGPMLDAIAGDAALISVSFANVVVDRVRIDQAGVPAAVATYVVSAATNQVDFSTPIPLRTVESIHVAKTTGPADAGEMTLRYDGAGGERTLVVAVDLGEGTGMQKVAFFAADRADRKQELMTHLQANRAYYTRAVLAGLDSASLVMLLSAFTWKGKPLADQVEPNPLAVAGNFLVLRAPVERDEASGLGEDGSTWGELLEARALTSGQQDARLVPIPTGGVFAEAVLGRSNASEKLDITRFWNWQDSPIPLQPPEIAPVTTGSRATAEDLKPGQLGAPVLNIVNPTALPAPTGLGAALTTLATANLFRDMSGLAGTQALAQSGAAGTLDAATAAGQLASANLKTVTDQAVAMGQTAADMWKTLHAPTGGGEGNGSRSTVSAEGARINQGRDLDRRGVTDAPGSASGSGNRMIESQSEFQAAGGGTDQMTSAPISRELAFTDIGAAGVSAPLMNGLVNALAQKGGGSGGGSTTTSTPTDAAILKQLRMDLIDVGKEFDPKLDLKKVKVLSMATHVNGKPFMLPEVGFQAWTNSDTEVYVNVPSVKTFLIDYQKAGNTAAEAMTLTRGFFISFLRHEVEHVRQFQKNKNSPPTKFADMVLFERAAYARSCDWITTGDADKYLNKRVGTTTNAALAAQLKSLEGVFKDTVLFLKTVPTSGNDKAIRNILIAGPPNTVPPSRYLPLELPSKSKPTQPLQDYDIGHLYKGAP